MSETFTGNFPKTDLDVTDNIKPVYQIEKKVDLNAISIKADAIHIYLELLEEKYFKKINEIETKLNGFKEILLRIERKIDNKNI
jgi:hypothetical protein